MHIEAELDDTHAERLLTLQQRLNKSVSEIIAGKNMFDLNISLIAEASRELA